MKLIRSFIQAQMAIAAIDKIPNEMMDDLIDVVDFWCDNAEFLDETGVQENALFKLPQREKLMNEILNKKVEDFKEMWFGFFVNIHTYSNLLWMMALKAEHGWTTISGHTFPHNTLPNVISNDADEKKENLLDDLSANLIFNLYWYSNDRCIHRYRPKSTWHKLAMNKLDENIRGVMTLDRIDYSDEPTSIIRPSNPKRIAVQNIINKSGTMQTVTFEKDMVDSITTLHSKANTWNWETSLSASFELSDVLLTVKSGGSVSNGNSETTTDSETKTTTTWNKFIFQLDAPACSIVNGDISVSTEHTIQNISHVFDIGGRQVRIRGERHMSNTLSQRYEVKHIEKIPDCIEQDSIDHCAFDNMDPSIIPQGEHEWRCRSTGGKTICKAHCLSGAHYNEDWYRVYCYHNTTFWYKFDKEQTPIDCS